MVIPADSGGRAESLAVESDARRRVRLVKNKRQHENYGNRHRRLRRQFARRIERGKVVICPRCGRGIGPDEGISGTTMPTPASSGPSIELVTAPPRTS
jgi:hypothetical protein